MAHHLEDKEDRKEITNFLDSLAQTNESPYLINVDRADGSYIWDKSGKKYMDMIAGVAVNNIGHRHPDVIKAIQNQIDKHLHVMVYGEYVQDAQNNAANSLHSILPQDLNCTYFVNSGTEANEGALKLAKRYTGRRKIVSCKASYHGSTHGSLSVTGNETKQSAFKPLLPEIEFIEFNNIDSLKIIDTTTAAVIIEPIQGDAGVRVPNQEFLEELRDICTSNGVLLIFDEVQTGMGRTGTMFAFEQFNIIPDILTLGKALGGGMPIGAFVSSKEIMHSLTNNPILGHITTFGGHPVICAAAHACIEVLKNEDWVKESNSKGQLLEDIIIQSQKVNEIRRAGLMFAIEMDSFETVKKVVDACLEKGLIGFWFLSCPDSFRLSPPLSITESELKHAGEIIFEAIEEIE